MLYESYIKENKIQEKTENEQKKELIKSIIETKKLMENARCNYNFAEDELIDFYLYQIKAYQAKLNYLIKKAKEHGIILERVKDIELRKEEKAV